MHLHYLNWCYEDDRAYMRFLLEGGNIIAGTSDTIPGLYASCSPAGILGLNYIKERQEKPYILLIDSFETMSIFADLHKCSSSIQKAIQACTKACWPGPLTVILPASISYTNKIQDSCETIAMRIPRHKGLQQLLTECQALFSTSANKTNMIAPQSIAEIDSTVLAHVAAIISDSTEKKVLSSEKVPVPSTIIDATGTTMRIIREGAYSRVSLENIIGQKLID